MTDRHTLETMESTYAWHIQMKGRRVEARNYTAGHYMAFVEKVATRDLRDLGLENDYEPTNLSFQVANEHSDFFIRDLYMLRITWAYARTPN